eukprot:Rhum_TRINITY_DN15413_c13_g1::Rhum_TRINITY_DN15413_c13_g1_i1::g.159591::m.159591
MEQQKIRGCCVACTRQLRSRGRSEEGNTLLARLQPVLLDRLLGLDGHRDRRLLTGSAVEGDLLLLEEPLEVAGDQHKVDVVADHEFLVHVGVRGGDARHGVEEETDRHHLARHREPVHDFELLQHLRLEELIRTHADVLLPHERDLTPVEVELCHLEADLADNTLLDVEDLLVVFKLDVQLVVDTHLHAHAFRKVLLTVVHGVLTPVRVRLEFLLNTAHPNFFFEGDVERRLLDRQLQQVLHLRVDAPVAVVHLLRVELERQRSRPAERAAVGLEFLLLPHELRHFLLVRVNRDDSNKLNENALVRHLAAGRHVQHTLHNLVAGVEVHLLTGRLPPVIDLHHVLRLLALHDQLDVTSLHLLHKLAEQATSLLLLGRLV